MSPLIALFVGYQAEEPQTLFRWPFRLPTETEPIPNLVVGHSERDTGKSKRRNGLWEPNTEPPPSRNRNWRLDVLDVWLPGARSLRSLNIIFVSPSDWLPKLF